MKYVSTRGEAPILDFADTLLTGLASDGGLYVPESYPRFERDEIAAMAGRPYHEIARQVLTPFVGDDISRQDLGKMIEEAYSGFHHRAVAPLVQTGANDWILELFHGPTLAFKDIAMQLLARLMDHVLDDRNRRATIIGATSGDTGGSAIEAFGGRERTDIFILFPAGRVSPVQQRQMTTSGHENVHAIAIDGNFDDCQALVKAMFNDARFRDKVGLSGVNSINWARIMAQIVYYFSAATSLGAPGRRVSFTVPTGNFGDIFAGYAAKRMGLDIDRLAIATNQNDILVRALESGRYAKGEVSATSSPSMDIQVSSNFERLLFECCGRDGSAVLRLMQALAQSGAFNLPDECLALIREDFSAGRSDEAETARMMASTLAETGYLADPHTTVGLKVAADIPTRGPMVTLATAHPSKFPDAVLAATGIRPALPAWAGDLMEREERYDSLASDLDAVERHIMERTRAVAA